MILIVDTPTGHAVYFSDEESAKTFAEKTLRDYGLDHVTIWTNRTEPFGVVYPAPEFHCCR